ncbi:MAG: hypothetical protein AAF416_18150 [Pseudomonadota bacterium]
MKVWTWPDCVGASHLYSPAHRARITETFSGAPGQITAQLPRATVTVSGTVAGRYDQADGRAAELAILLDRLEGGQSLVTVWDSVMRRRCGWSSAVAGVGDSEVWRADGQVGQWAGQVGGDPGWRSVLVSGSGSAGSTSLTLGGLLAGEVMPLGAMIRVGDERYLAAATVTESGGSASVTLSRPLVAAPSGNVRYPGDLMVGRLIGQPELGQDDLRSGRTFSITLQEVYAAEVDGGFEYQ